MLAELLVKELESFDSKFEISLYFKTGCVLINDLSLLKATELYVRKNKDIQSILPITIKDGNKTETYYYKYEDNKLKYILADEFEELYNALYYETLKSGTAEEDDESDTVCFITGENAILASSVICFYFFTGLIIGLVYSLSNSLALTLIIGVPLYFVVNIFSDNKDFPYLVISFLLYIGGEAVGAILDLSVGGYAGMTDYLQNAMDRLINSLNN